MVFVETFNYYGPCFCVDAIDEAIERYGRLEIFNTDLGLQFTSFEFTSMLKEKGIKISMDGKGKWGNISLLSALVFRLSDCT
ncbi:MAG: hypothetical protein COV66_10700 [Nitrospinae bacterium CG11_big_fil_rev_8_21_14_0_20_45_15]|nr:MAG: hypothetical protein COV66_10700 [Nitrospinae bacterium CG11_big_fil_rev_8_21_14_0_20_45_15]